MLMKKFGFTMIELLVVIAVIGILAVALLSTLNPLEQIRKGRDTRTRTDMSQLISGLERYNASLGYFPWQDSEGEDVINGAADINWLAIGGADADATLGTALDALTDTNEVKASFVDRITASTATAAYMYYNDEVPGASVITCWKPESQTFLKEAFERCKVGATSFPSELSTKYTTVCPASSYAGEFDAATAEEMLCLP